MPHQEAHCQPVIQGILSDQSALFQREHISTVTAEGENGGEGGGGVHNIWRSQRGREKMSEKKV